MICFVPRCEPPGRSRAPGHPPKTSATALRDLAQGQGVASGSATEPWPRQQPLPGCCFRQGRRKKRRRRRRAGSGAGRRHRSVLECPSEALLFTQCSG